MLWSSPATPTSPLHPTPRSFVCPTEITAFSDRYEEFKALNTEVLGVSIDSQFSHLAWIQTGAWVERGRAGWVGGEERGRGGAGESRQLPCWKACMLAELSYLLPRQLTHVHSPSLPRRPQVWRRG